MIRTPKMAWFNENTVMPFAPAAEATPGILSLNSSMTRGTAVMKSAPRMGPNVVPTPPTTIMAMYWSDTKSPKSLGRDELLVGAEQRAGERGQRARHDEGQHLGVARLDADGLGGRVAVSHRLHRPAGPGSGEVLRREGHDGDEDPDHVEEALVAGEGVAEHRQVGEVDRADDRRRCQPECRSGRPVTDVQFSNTCCPRNTRPSVMMAR